MTVSAFTAPDLETHRDHYPHELSGGQQQRTAAARAFAPNPSFVIMDEPFAGVDIHTRDRMRQWLQTISTCDAKTILFPTHYLDEAIMLSDRIIVLKGGGQTAEFHVRFPRPQMEGLKFNRLFFDLKRRLSKAIEQP